MYVDSHIICYNLENVNLFPKQLPAVGVLAVLVEGPVDWTRHREPDARPDLLQKPIQN